MKKSKIRELELLRTVCKQHDVPLKLAQDLIKSAKKYSYENVSQGTRVKDLQELIEFHSK